MDLSLKLVEVKVEDVKPKSVLLEHLFFFFHYFLSIISFIG